MSDNVELLLPLKPYGVIYSIHNKINNKYYIGQTTDKLAYRWRKHVGLARNTSRPLHEDIKKHGETVFKIEIVCVTFSKEESDAMEVYYVQRYGAIWPNGYNLRDGGTSGWSPSDETKSKLREAATRQFADPENRQRHSDIALAQFADPEKRQRHKDAHNTPEFKARVSELHSNTIWINDGKTNRHLKDDVPVPDGWSLGVVNYGSTPDARKNAQLIGRHNRWHARRGITNPDCALCAETLSDAKEVGT